MGQAEMEQKQRETERERITKMCANKSGTSELCERCSDESVETVLPYWNIQFLYSHRAQERRRDKRQFDSWNSRVQINDLFIYFFVWKRNFFFIGRSFWCCITHYANKSILVGLSRKTLLRNQRKNQCSLFTVQVGPMYNARHTKRTYDGHTQPEHYFLHFKKKKRNLKNVLDFGANIWRDEKSFAKCE